MEPMESNSMEARFNEGLRPYQIVFSQVLHSAPRETFSLLRKNGKQEKLTTLCVLPKKATVGIGFLA
jgi:hypothetical protein